MKKLSWMGFFAAITAATIGVPMKTAEAYRPLEVPIVGEGCIRHSEVPMGTTAGYMHYPETEVDRIKSIVGQKDEEIKRDVSTVLGASIFCTELLEEMGRENRLTGCARAMVEAAYLLSDDGFPSYCLVLQQSDGSNGHCVFLYGCGEDETVGTIGANTWDINPPIYDSLSELVSTMNRRSG